MKFTKEIELAGESVIELMNIATSLSEENSTQYNKLKQLRELIAVRNTEVNKLNVRVDSVSKCNERQCETITKKRREIETLMIINANVTSDNQSLRDMNRNQFAILEANKVDQPEITHLTEVVDGLNSVNVSLQDSLDSANAKINTQFAELFEANAKLNFKSDGGIQFPIKRIKELEGQISVLQGTNVKLIKEQAKVKAFFEGL